MGVFWLIGRLAGREGWSPVETWTPGGRVSGACDGEFDGNSFFGRPGTKLLATTAIMLIARSPMLASRTEPASAILICGRKDARAVPLKPVDELRTNPTWFGFENSSASLL